MIVFLNRASSLQRTAHIPFVRRYSGTATKTIETWMKQRQNNLNIFKTSTTPRGQILDWVPIESQTNETIASPPPVTLHQLVESDPNRPTRSVRFDVGVQGPAGCVPILRPDVSTLTESALEVGKQGGLLLNTDVSAYAAPNMRGYFHATCVQSISAYGCQGTFNVWNPTVDNSVAKGGDHSISQIWLVNNQKGHRQTIEGGLVVKQAINGDTATHVFTYFTTCGYEPPSGDNLGGWNRLQKGWIQVHPTLFPGMNVGVENSTPGGTQYEISMQFSLVQNNWWFGLSQNGSFSWLGYYPSSLFNGGLGDHAESVHFGGEIHSSLTNPCTTTNQMGSGRQAAIGWGYAAYQRNLLVQTDATGTLTRFRGKGEFGTGANCNPNPYTIATVGNQTTWGTYQYFGGPTA